ncbi:hypothetical protein JHK87_001157 [Glycine soja]|nr:hypothetical protein JHK87_001157 [Glycine soja]
MKEDPKEDLERGFHVESSHGGLVETKHKKESGEEKTGRQRGNEEMARSPDFIKNIDNMKTGVRLPIGVPMLNSSAKDQSLSQSPGSSQYSEKDKFFYKVEVKSLA